MTWKQIMEFLKENGWENIKFGIDDEETPDEETLDEETPGLTIKIKDYEDLVDFKLFFEGIYEEPDDDTVICSKDDLRKIILDARGLFTGFYNMLKIALPDEWTRERAKLTKKTLKHLDKTLKAL